MYKSLNRPSRHQIPFTPIRKVGDEIVKNGLAITPQQMLEMSNRGLAVSSSMNAHVLEDYAKDHDYEVPLQYRRGADMADLFVARRDVQEKFRGLHRGLVERHAIEQKGLES